MALPSNSLKRQALELLGNGATPPRSELSSVSGAKATTNFFATEDSNAGVSRQKAKRATAGVSVTGAEGASGA